MYWIITFWNRCTENISGSCYYLLCKICTLCYSYLHYQVICERFPHNKLNGSRNTRIAGTYFGNMEIWITLYCSRNIYKSMFITFKKKKRLFLLSLGHLGCSATVLLKKHSFSSYGLGISWMLRNKVIFPQLCIIMLPCSHLAYIFFC